MVRVVEQLVHKIVVVLVVKVELVQLDKEMLVDIHHEHPMRVDKVVEEEEQVPLVQMLQIIMEETVVLVQLIIIERVLI